MIAYLETSAAAKLLKEESESDAIKLYLNDQVDSGERVVSSTLLETELRRTAVRQGVEQSTINDILDRIDIFDLTRSAFISAGILPAAGLRSLDALHIVAAMRVNADVIITYDERMKQSAESAGMKTHSPS